MYELRGRNAIVTGASQGFGYEFTRRLVMAGAKVCMTDIKTDLGEKSAEEIRTMFGKDEESVFFVKCDVSVANDWSLMWDRAEGVFKGQVDILCNNAGIAPSTGWEPCLNVMSIGFTRGIFIALQRMGTSNGGHGGRIINTASIAGLTYGYLGDIYSCGYEISKWGNIVLTRLFGEVKPNPYETDGIKCYALCPWFANTNIIGPHAAEIEEASKHRILTLEEVGDLFMTSLELDKNGAVYAQFPDIPILEYTSARNYVFLLHVVIGKVVAPLGIKVLSPRHIVLITLVCLWLFFTLLNQILSVLMSACF